MSLQVWLPLTKNVEQQGLSNITVTNNGATFSSNGKLGGCYTVDNSKQIGCSNNITLGNTFSVVFWSKINSKNVDWGNIFKIYKDGYDYIGMCLAYKTDTNPKLGFHIFRNNGSNAREAVIDGYKDYTLNEWFHTAIIVTPTKATVYRNGEIYNTFVINKSFPLITNYSLWLGKNGIGNGLDCSINDFRIYDNALSPREVKEISKGLVLHYPLAMPGQENLVTGSNTNSTSTNKWFGHSSVGGNASTIEVDETGTNCVKVTRDSTTQSSWDFLSYDALLRNQLKTNTTYTVSFDAKPSVDGTINLVGLMGGNATNNMTASVVQVQSNLLANKWNHCVYHCTTLNSFDGITISGQIVYLSRSASLRGVNTTVLFKNIKVEEGEIDTPWIPNSADAEYSTLGFNDGIEYDVSGYKNNGTKAGTLTYDADTPRYNTSTVFDGTTHIINNTSTVHLSNEFTISWWGKINTWRQLWEGMFILQNTTALNSASGTYSIANAIHASTANKMALTLRQGGTNYPFDHYEWTYTVGTWGHYACTYKDGVIIMYQNGAQVYTATIDNNSSGDYYYTIGKRSSYCNCQMSDFRIYNTALSASDILELYHTPISLSNNGALLTQGEYVES